MAVAEKNAKVTSTVTKEVKNILEKLAEKNHRSLSKEISFALDSYLCDEKRIAEVNRLLENARLVDKENK